MKVNIWSGALIFVLITLPGLLGAVTIVELTSLAKQYHDPIAQYLLGRYYLKNDVHEAIKWLKLAANNGHFLSKYKLGILYYEGDVVTQDYRKAKKYLKEPAKKGKEKASFILGNIYDQGLGVDKNSRRAFTYFSLGAGNYHPMSLYKVAKCYYNGKGVPKNYKKAKHWAELAIQYNAPGAKKLLQLIEEAEEKTKKNKSLVNKYRTNSKKGDLHAIKNSASAKSQLVNYSEKEQKISKNYKVRKQKNKVFDFSEIILAANEGDKNSQFKLAQAYLSGSKGVKKNTTYALDWYIKAADSGHLKSQYLLGKMYLDGDIIKKSVASGKKWLQRAADQGLSAAKILLGKLINDSTLNGNLSINLLRKSAKSGDMEAQYQMGIMYGEGQGIRKSIASSRKWLRLAAKQGHMGAKRRLSGCDKDDGRVFHGVNNPC